MRTYHEAKATRGCSPKHQQHKTMTSPSYYHSNLVDNLEQRRVRNRTVLGQTMTNAMGTLHESIEPHAIKGVFLARVGVQSKEKDPFYRPVKNPQTKVQYCMPMEKENIRVNEKRSYELPRNHSTYLPQNFNPEFEQLRTRPTHILSPSPTVTRLIDKNQTQHECRNPPRETVEYIQGLQNYIRYLERIVERQNSANAILERRSQQQSEDLCRLQNQIQRLQDKLVKLEHSYLTQQIDHQQAHHSYESQQIIGGNLVVSEEFIQEQPTQKLQQPHDYASPLLKYGVPPLNLSQSPNKYN